MNRKGFALANSFRGIKSSVCMPPCPFALHLHTYPWLCSLPGKKPPWAAPPKKPNPNKKSCWHWSPGASHKWGRQSECWYISSCLPGEPVLHMERCTASSLMLEKVMPFCTIIFPAQHRSCRGSPISGQSKGASFHVAPSHPVPLGPGIAALPSLPACSQAAGEVKRAVEGGLNIRS